MEKRPNQKLSSDWQSVEHEYDIQGLVGSGTYGQVVKARAKTTGKTVAIKLIDDVFKNLYSCKKVLREITILRKLSKMPRNVFTTKLYDVLLPVTTKEEMDSFDKVFLVMSYEKYDLKSIFESKEAPDLDVKHVVTILYNILCSMNFLHTANIIHRDLKPSNILVSAECQIKICDFGLARAMPKKLVEAMELKTRALHKSHL